MIFEICRSEFYRITIIKKLSRSFTTDTNAIYPLLQQTLTPPFLRYSETGQVPDLPQHDQQLLLHQERRRAAVGAEAAALPQPTTLQPVPLPLEAAVTDGRVKCNVCGNEFSNRFWTQFGSEVRFSKEILFGLRRVKRGFCT